MRCRKTPGVKFFAVCVGGALGSGLRYLLALFALRIWGPGFPVGTLLANCLGCLLMGLLSAWGVSSGGKSEVLRVTLTTGLLGGFTTFSAFSNDTVQLIRNGSGAAATLYLVLTVAMGLLLVAGGHGLGRLLLR